jgi:NADH-quinone oxidoreductase subunit I
MSIPIQRGKAITVDRHARKTPMGQGLMRGLGVILKHWGASVQKNDSYDKIQGTFTIEYPEERRQLPEAYRNMPILLYDEQTGHELCTSCFQCERICPPQVIHMTQAKDPETGKPVPAVDSFEI